VERLWNMTTSLATGQIFANRYEVVRCIGSGGMGAVYEVIHLETERRRALKVMHAHFADSVDFRERFKREARVAAQVDSEYIVDVFDAGVDDATKMPFLAMELLRGEELARTLKRVGRMAPSDVVSCLHQTSLALDRTHKASIVHRDLKPENIFLCERDDGPSQIKVLDFGIAKFATSAKGSSQVTNSVGTPLYMAPEQFMQGAEITPAADIYALGLLAYTLLVGTDYWHEELERDDNVFAFALIAMKGPSEPPSARALRVAGLPLAPAFDDWFGKATAVPPSMRFATASEAVRELSTALRVNLPPPRPIATALHGLGREMMPTDPMHSSRTTPAGSAATMELRAPRARRRFAAVAVTMAMLAVGGATFALRADRTAGSDKALSPIAALGHAASPVPGPNPPATMAVEAPSTEALPTRPKLAEPAATTAKTGAAPKPRLKAPRPAAGAGVKPPQRPIYSRD
jgi:eukaryotic-like serine/threonine-protein kinase